MFRAYDPADPGFAIRARFYALCAGGIENPRLLLAFRSQEPAGIGNGNDLVGRFFCEHPSFVVADVLYERTLDARFEFYAPTPAFMAEQAILNVGIRLCSDPPPPPLGLGKATARSLACSADFLAALAERVLGRPPGCERDGLGAWLARGGAPAPQTGRIEAASEQALDRDSRVRLGNERDAFGLPRPELDWRLGELDYRTIRIGATALAMHIAEQGIGRARIRDWLLAEQPRIPGMPRARLAAGTTCARRGWPTTRATVSSTATAGCTGSRTSTSAARACSRPPATPTRPTRSSSWRSGSATI